VVTLDKVTSRGLSTDTRRLSFTGVGVTSDGYRLFKAQVDEAAPEGFAGLNSQSKGRNPFAFLAHFPSR
jgi:hypothetical protein